MKKLVKLVSPIVLLLLFSIATARAQKINTDISIDVSAKITSSIELITVHPIKLSEDGTQNGSISIDPIRSGNAGKIIAKGNPGSKIRISYLENKELSQKSDAKLLHFNYKVAGNKEDDQATSELLRQDNRDFEFNEKGKFFIWIGGNVDISRASPGNYQGDFTLQIDYI